MGEGGHLGFYAINMEPVESIPPWPGAGAPWSSFRMSPASWCHILTAVWLQVSPCALHTTGLYLLQNQWRREGGQEEDHVAQHSSSEAQRKARHRLWA